MECFFPSSSQLTLTPLIPTLPRGANHASEHKISVRRSQIRLTNDKPSRPRPKAIKVSQTKRTYISSQHLPSKLSKLSNNCMRSATPNHYPLTRLLVTYQVRRAVVMTRLSATVCAAVSHRLKLPNLRPEWLKKFSGHQKAMNWLDPLPKSSVSVESAKFLEVCEPLG